MTTDAPSPKTRKGARTAERVLDAAEPIFAERGYEGTSLREIAREVGIHEPGIYNHFKGKEALYAAVLDRALAPMLDAMRDAVAAPLDERAIRALPALITDQLAAHPSMAALFHQALQSDPESEAGRLIEDWLGRLFGEGLATLDRLASRASGSAASGRDTRAQAAREDLAIRVIAMFNLTAGYFISERAFAVLTGSRDQLCEPENIARQKQLLDQFADALLER